MATAAAAIVAQANLEIQHHLFAVDAVRPDRAVVFTPSSAIEGRQFAKMLERGIIKREGANRYWIDVVAYDIDVHRQHRQVKFALLILIILLVAALIGVAISSWHTLML